MEFGILGPIVARVDGRPLPLGGPKPRALLAMLLLHANEPVSRDSLIEGLWGERPPPSASHTLDDYVSRLRRKLGASRIERHPPGYMLRLEPGELDADRFDVLLREGREQITGGDPEQAATTIRAALAIWRGRALADVLYEPFASFEAERLEERRLLAFEQRFEADLGSGAAADLVPELEPLVPEHPFRERLAGQL